MKKGDLIKSGKGDFPRFQSDETYKKNYDKIFKKKKKCT